MKRLLLLAFLILAFLNGCAGTGGGLGSISKTNRLTPGMKPNEVKAVLGEPLQTQFVANKWVWKYSLHEPWKGWVPYYLAFGKESKILEEWYADEQEYMQQQELWMQAFSPVPVQRYEVDVTVR